MTLARVPPGGTAAKGQRSRTLIHDPWQMQAGKLTRLPTTRAGAGTKHSLGTHASSSSSKAAYCCTLRACYHSIKVAVFLTQEWTVSHKQTHLLCSHCCYLGDDLWEMLTAESWAKQPIHLLYSEFEELMNHNSQMQFQVSHRYPVRRWTNNPSAPVAISVKLGLTFICLEGRLKG